MRRTNLLASAATVDGITAMVNRFYVSTAYTVDPTTLDIVHPDRPAPRGVRVIQKGKRYRFEMTDD